MPSAPRRLCFGAFEIDLDTGELRTGAGRVKLQPQPFKVLALLAGRAGSVVSRDEIKHEVWGPDTFVDFERGLNFCVAQVRAALGDDADAPRFIETLPRRGYRFIAPVVVEPLTPVPESAIAAFGTSTVDELAEGARVPASLPSRSRGSLPRSAASAWFLVLTLAIAGFAAYTIFNRQPLESAPAGDRRLTIAVLPFDNLSPDPSQAFFADGLTEEVIAQLGRIRPARLGVIARTSAMIYKARRRDVRGIGRELNVEYLLEGSVRRDETGVRITAQLIRVSDQTNVWSATYDRTPDAALALQRDVAERVAGALQAELLAGAAPLGRGTSSPEAYEAYLRGRYLWNRGGRGDLPAAIEYFGRAIAADPEYAAAHSALATAYHRLVMSGGGRPHDAYPHARRAALEGIRLDPAQAEAFAALGAVAFWYDWNWPEAERAFSRALALNPSLPAAHHDYGWLLIATGRPDAGIAEIRTAQNLDPLSPHANINVGWALIRAGRYDEAIQQSSRTLALEPAFGEAQVCLEVSYRMQGKDAEALEQVKTSLLKDGVSGEEVAALTAGDPSIALQRVAARRLARLQRLSRERDVNPMNLATQYAALGKNDEAVDWLEKAYADRQPMIVALAVDPAFRTLREDARFRHLLDRIGPKARLETQ